MPPKVKITRDDIINATVRLVRENGECAINARAIAQSLSCSTQPIFSNFSTMDELKKAVMDSAEKLYDEYTKREIDNALYPHYKAHGMAYIRFAKEEKELFKFLYMRDRSNEDTRHSKALFNKMEDEVHSITGLDGDDATLFHLEIWAYVHGIAAMFATSYLDLDWELVSKMITDAYQGLKKQYEVQ